MTDLGSGGLGTPRTGREYLETQVAERARHRSAEDVRTTCSFARAERLLGREYHGRFLIELLQNAADAWRSDTRSRTSRSRVAVVVGEGPALLVANQGTVMTPEVVIESLGHIGASTKAEGEAIGHKGIGFKSVLEITLAPEVYSGLQQSEPVLSVAFDAELARATIGKESPRWDEWVSSVQGLDPSDPAAAIPILRFPHWQDELPPDVGRLAADGFDTVIRLPFGTDSARRIGLTEDAFLSTIRDALNDVSDRILLLLGCFSEVRVEDRLASTDVRITPLWERPSSAVPAPHTREDVSFLRDGETSSRWRLFRRSVPASGDLAGEVAVGLRYNLSEHEAATVLPAVDGQPSAPFHLFFPTRIASGLPFLLHGYFEVDAARTGFYRGSADRNTAILNALADVVADAVLETARDSSVDQTTLVNEIAACDEPEESLARQFRARVLGLLDHQPWLPVHGGGESDDRASPSGVFVVEPHLTRAVARVFAPDYVATRVRLAVPERRLSDPALELIRSRQPRNHPVLWDTLKDLCRPGPTDIWAGTDADQGFVALLDLLDALRVQDRRAAETLIDGLRGDSTARLLPVSEVSGGRTLLPVPDPADARAGRRGRLVMARARATGGTSLVPPEELDLAFLPDGLLASEADVDRAKPLGVRPFTVDNVLDRLNGIGESNVDPPDLLRFLWRLLSRERASGFGTKRSAERASVFDPGQWFWCRPGRAREDETARLRQQRERYLAEVPLPTRQGEWRPAGSLAFGADWADWLESAAPDTEGSPSTSQRVAAYRVLEAICPGHRAMLAPPEIVLAFLSEDSFTQPLDPGDEQEDELDHSARDVERHAFLLRLGVWEVPPIEAFESRSTANRERFPWVGRTAELQRAEVEAAGGWAFGLTGWGGQQHHTVYLAEDFRFVWALPDAAARDTRALAHGLRMGINLYRDRMTAQVFCPGCRDSGSSHTASRQSSTAHGYPSQLALQLGRDPWVGCTLDGAEMVQPVPPVAAWWRDRPPTGAGLRQSPWRLLPLSGPPTGMTDDLRRLAGVNTIETADLAVVRTLLAGLRAQYEADALGIDPATSGSARQAFVGLHRLAYERLADISDENKPGVADVLSEVGVLCELGDHLVYRPPDEVRHDDGKFSTYTRHFAGKVPLIVLARDQDSRASRLGVRPLVVTLTRQGDDNGTDVTDEVHSLLADRIPELLAIVVHHSLGAQTLEPSSLQFEERARRLQAMTVRYTRDLVIHASIDGTPHSVTLGEGSDQDVFLENPTSSAPVLFHDLAGNGWQERLRRKLAPHLARVLENSAYTHTFALFLQADGDAEREEFLLELGISGNEVDAIAARIGVVSEEEKQQHLRWYRGLITAVGAAVPADLSLDPTQLQTVLVAAGLSDGVAHTIVEAGGGEAVRRDTREGSPLRALSDAGVDLRVLHGALVDAGDAGLALAVTRRRFARWIDAHGRRVAVVLATRVDADTAKAAVHALEPPDSLAFALDPPVVGLIAPVVALLAAEGFDVTASDLVQDPPDVLARIGGFDSAAVLDEQVPRLFDEEERRRVLRERAAEWRRQIRLLAVLSRMGPAETRATVKALADVVDATLGGIYSSPSRLRDPLNDLFFEHGTLRDWLADQLIDSILVEMPAREDLLARASALGVDVAQIDVLMRALDAPRRDHARRTKARAHELASSGIAPRPPKGLAAPSTRRTPASTGRKRVAAVKVDASHDRRKRELGDEGEQWALASVIGPLLRLDTETRGQAIDDICELLTRFEGSPVDAVLGHADIVRSRDLDEEELIDELTGLLHVSRHSDAFGFDLIGWLPVCEGGTPVAICLEVKSTGGDGFPLTTSEWALAERLHTDGEGDRYAVLAVLRSRGGGAPLGMDLLIDPVGLHEAGHLRRDVDGYKIVYQADAERRGTTR